LIDGLINDVVGRVVRVKDLKDVVVEHPGLGVGGTLLGLSV